MGKDYRNLPVSVLRDDIVRLYKRQYSILDAAHREEHFQEVEKTASDINWQLRLGYDDRLICLAAYVHDLFTWTRPNHHLLAETHVLTTTHSVMAWLTTEERKMLSRACAEHRASYKGTYTSTFSELISAADRGKPGNVQEMVKRCIAYAMSHGTDDRDKAYKHAQEHLKYKYGREGYARFNDVYLKVFGNELKAFQQEIEAL